MINDYLTRYVNKTGLTRNILAKEVYAKNVSDVVVHPFFGDLQSCIFSGQVLFEREINPKKYNVVVTWPGLANFFNGASEVWCLNSSYNFKSFHNQAQGLENNSQAKNILLRSLNENFSNVDSLENFKSKFNHIITNKFLEKPKFSVKGFVPFAANQLNGIEKSNKKKVCIFPFSYFKTIDDKKTSYTAYNQIIYLELIRKLLTFGYHVFCVQNDWTYDIKSLYTSSEITWVQDNDLKRVVSYIHHTGCFLDFFHDLQSLGLLAQVPTFSLYERTYYTEARKSLERDILDFTNSNELFFSFLFMCNKDSDLNIDFLTSIIERFDDFYQRKVINHQKQFVVQKEMDVSGYIKKRVQKYKPRFISMMLEQKEREKHEKS